LKKLIGNTEIEDALQRLDRLTLEDAHMAAAELLRISHNVESGMIRINEGVQDVNRVVQGVGDQVEDVDTKVQEVDERVQGVRDTVEDVGEGVKDVRKGVEDVGGGVQDVRKTVQGIGDGVQDIRKTVQGVDDQVEQIDRESSPDSFSVASQPPEFFTGNRLRERFQSWLSPLNPSINHNVACNAQHEGTSQWFFRGSIFNQWKSTDAFLWVHGKRAFLSSLSLLPALTTSNPIAGSGKSILWFVNPHQFHTKTLTQSYGSAIIEDIMA
jgi:archaellum component FlaC